MVQVMLFSPATVFVENQLRAESLLVRFFVCPPNPRKRSYSGSAQSRDALFRSHRSSGLPHRRLSCILET